MECLVKIVDSFQSLTIFGKCSILDVWQDSELASGKYNNLKKIVLKVKHTHC